MSNDIFLALEKTAKAMGESDARWFKKKIEPEYEAAVYGDKGPVMILLHGLFGAMSNWDSTIPYLQEFAQVHVLKFPILTGHRSEVRVKALSLLTHHYILTEKLDNLILCGNSLGGHVALRLALAIPDQVNALILSGSSGLYEHTVDSLPVRPGHNFVREQMKRVFFNQQLVTENAIDEIAEILSDRGRQINLIHAARSAKKDYMFDELPAIKCPSLLLWGENDEVTTLTVAKTFNERIPNSKLITIAGCGHAPMIEHPKWFADHIKSFLQTNKLL